ncbi:MAG: hypothetical protein IB618_02050 [Candidatus Pacearchaeota archaeon]|nr:MAG: hypothetical protein IB618_02050 [Candidatus Pacearchaeota archaeon]
MAKGKTSWLEKFTESDINITDWFFNLVSDFSIVLYYKIFGNGCNPIEREDTMCCYVSRKFDKKSRVKYLCNYGALDKDCRIQKKRSDERIKYEYCKCVLDEKKNLINQVCVLLDKIKRGKEVKKSEVY